jgi:hypothetical protein
MKKLSFAEVLTNLVDAKLLQVHTTMPGRVEKYDADKQLADIKPLLKLPARGEDGKIRWYALPVVTNVPVEFPGAGDFRICFPIKKGNTGKLTFTESSIDKWLENGGLVSPDDLRRFHLSDGIFTPGLHPKNKSWKDADGNYFTIGKDSETAQFVALANKVKDALDDFKSWANGHTHSLAGGSVVVTGSSTTQNNPNPITVPAPASGWGGDTAVASATVKIKG